MGREFELKYRADSGVFQWLLARFGNFTEILMETAYYDAPDGALQARKWMLRLRLENGVSVCTLKTPLPDGSRGEWNVEAASIEGGIEELCKLDAPKELADLTKNGVVQTCAARFLRQAAEIVLTDCTVELALDMGSFQGGGREVPFSELEVELKHGSETAAAAFAESLAREFQLEKEEKSKAQRAFALLP